MHHHFAQGHVKARVPTFLLQRRLWFSRAAGDETLVEAVLVSYQLGMQLKGTGMRLRPADQAEVLARLAQLECGDLVDFEQECPGQLLEALEGFWPQDVSSLGRYPTCAHRCIACEP